MVSGQWFGRTTMLSSFCVKTGVVSDHFQFTKWISWRIRVDFNTSMIWHSWLREVNTSAIELIMIASNLGKGSNSPFEWSALLPLPDHQQQWTLHQPRQRPHHDAIQVSKFYFLSQGQYHGMICIMRSSTRSKEDQMIIPSTPDTTSRYEFFW